MSYLSLKNTGAILRVKGERSRSSPVVRNSTEPSACPARNPAHATLARISCLSVPASARCADASVQPVRDGSPAGSYHLLPRKHVSWYALLGASTLCLRLVDKICCGSQSTTLAAMAAAMVTLTTCRRYLLATAGHAALFHSQLATPVQISLSHALRSAGGTPRERLPASLRAHSVVCKPLRVVSRYAIRGCCAFVCVLKYFCSEAQAVTACLRGVDSVVADGTRSGTREWWQRHRLVLGSSGNDHHSTD